MTSKQIDTENILPGELTLDDVEKTREFLRKLSLSEVIEWAKNRTQVFYCGDQDFRMVVDRPSESSGKLVVVLSEFGTNILPRLTVKSMIIRDMIDPGADLVIQPSSVIGEPNMNFSHPERKKLFHGDLNPIIGRLAVTMHFLNDPEDVVMFGPSQGASVALAFGGSKDTPPVKVAAVEAPTVVKRSMGQLVGDFVSSSEGLSEIVEKNFDDHSNSFASDTENASNPVGEAVWFSRSMHPDNIAIGGGLRFATARGDIGSVLDKGGAVMHAWTEEDKVSPVGANQAITDEFESNPRYQKRIIYGLSHAATDFYALDGALARLADRIND